MAGVPGFSITELIQAAAKTKQVYDAFFHKYDNASNRVRDLRDTVDLFRLNLVSHRWLLDSSGRTYPGLDAFSRTLAECNDFVDKYQKLLDSSRSKARDAVRTIAWTFEDRHISGLTRQLQLHIQALNGFTLNLLLKMAMEKDTPTTTHYTRSQSVNVHVHPSSSALPEIGGLYLEQSSQLRIEESESAKALAGLWQEVQVYNNRQKRIQNQSVQSGRGMLGHERSRRESMQLLAGQEIQSVVEKWKSIARANGVDERHLPVISRDQPLETADEFCKRLLQASELATIPKMPMSPTPLSPNLDQAGVPGSPRIQALPPESIAATTPADSLWTHHSIDSTTPISLGFNAGSMEPLDLPPANVLDCRVNLNLKPRDKRSVYPTLELKRLEVQPVQGSREIEIVCTTVKNMRIHHRLPLGSRTHPYTKHRSLNKPREVSFLDQHQILQGKTTHTGDPVYTFFSDADCKAFQDLIRSRLLVHTWEIDKIAFRTSDTLGEATDQHLKIWRDFDGGSLSITFFANNPSDSKGRRHREFPLSRFDLATPNSKRRSGGIVRLEFRSARRDSLNGGSGGMGFCDLSSIPLGSYPSSIESTSPLASSPTKHSPRLGHAATHASESGDTNTLSPNPRRNSIRRPGRLPSLSSLTGFTTSGTDDPETPTTARIATGVSLGSPAPGILTEDEASRLRYMDVTFTDKEVKPSTYGRADADRFEKLLPQIWHI